MKCPYLLLFTICMFCSRLGLCLNITERIKAAFQPRQHVLAIGINDFNDPTFAKLHYADFDAHEVFSTFKTIGYENAKLLNSAKVYTWQIKKSLKELREEVHENDTVVIYISSHGTWKADEYGVKKRYIAASDTNIYNPEQTALSYSYLMQIFHSLPAKKKALIFAFCYSGEGKSGLSFLEEDTGQKSIGLDFDEDISDEALSSGTFIYAASMQHQAAFEHSILKHDVYTYFLLEAIRNIQTVTTLSEAHDYAVLKTQKFVSDFLGKNQTPTANIITLGSPSICISRRGCSPNSPYLSFFPWPYDNYQISINGKDYRSVPKGMHVPSGINHIVINAQGKTLYDGSLHFQKGKEYSLSKLLAPKMKQAASLGLHDLYFHSQDYRQKFASAHHFGLSANYQYDDFLEISDISLNFSYFPKKDETLTYHGYSLTHARSQILGDIYAGKKAKSSWLSRPDGSLTTCVRLYTGLSLLLYQSESTARAFAHTSHTGLLWGPSVSGHIDSRIHSLGLRFGTHLSLTFYHNWLGTRSTAHNLSFSLGKFW